MRIFFIIILLCQFFLVSGQSKFYIKTIKESAKLHATKLLIGNGDDSTYLSAVNANGNTLFIYKLDLISGNFQKLELSNSILNGKIAEVHYMRFIDDFINVCIEQPGGGDILNLFVTKDLKFHSIKTFNLDSLNKPIFKQVIYYFDTTFIAYSVAGINRIEIVTYNKNGDFLSKESINKAIVQGFGLIHQDGFTILASLDQDINIARLYLDKITSQSKIVDQKVFYLPPQWDLSKVNIWKTNDGFLFSSTKFKTSGQRNEDIFILKVDQNLDSVFYIELTNPFDTFNKVSTAYDDRIIDLAAFPDNSFTVLWEMGNTTFPGMTQLVHFSSSGDLIWKTVLDSASFSRKFTDLAPIPDGYLILGHNHSGEVIVYKTNPWGTFSGLKEKSEEAEIINNLRFYPNPSYGNFNISFLLKKPEKVNIEVYSLSGKQVAQKYYGDLPAGENKLNIDLSGQKPGLYLYRMQIGQDAKFGKLLVR